MTSIQKTIISAFGDPFNVSVITASISPPPPQHAQVRVLYSGFSGADINMRLGRYPMQKKAPLTPGYCFVGTVAAIGPQCSKFNPGDTVVCVSVYDAQSTLVNMPEKYLVSVPEGLDTQKACALVLDWNTAYGMVFHSANVSAGHKVFIHGCSGAVGYALLALCKLRGADVYGTCSERNFDAIRRLGATPFSYRDKAWIGEMQKLRGADAVFDALGYESWDESYSILSPNGILLGYGGNLKTLTGQPAGSVVWPTLKLLGRNLILWSGKRTTFYYIERNHWTFEPDLKALFELVGEGKVEVLVKKVWALEDVRQAHLGFNSAEGIGSCLIKVGDDVS
ncbi:MAG: hypothetical protein LQ341_004262 [Variospora aurantia]|nr:MAG: hypothetical protein LQ341_004262 [Variospora aurantia]